MPLFNRALATSASHSADSGKLHQAESYATLPSTADGATTGDIGVVNGKKYKFNGSGWQPHQGTVSAITVATIGARDQLAADILQIGTIARVIDASADSTVTSGWAEYLCISLKPQITWSKRAEGESVDAAEAVQINPEQVLSAIN